MAKSLEEQLQEVIDDPNLMEIGRKSVEDTLIELRDSRIAVLRNNGLVIKERDGTPSCVIRMGPEQCVKVALKAMIDRLTAVSIK